MIVWKQSKIKIIGKVFIKTNANKVFKYSENVVKNLYDKSNSSESLN